jgi:small subunit ribosomal protein S7
MVEEAPKQKTKAPEPAAAPQAAVAPPVTAEAAPETAPAADQKDENPLLGKVLLFGKFDVSGVAVRDVGMAMYIDVTPIAVPHTGAKHSNKPFARSKMSIVERLINNMMRTEVYTGKKIKAYRAVENAFIIVNKKTSQNPLQLFVDALQNAAPREEVTRLRYGGISVPKAVDVAPARRVDLALRHVCLSALEASHGSKKPIEECLADEIIAAARNDANCHAIAKKDEAERVSSSAR